MAMPSTPKEQRQQTADVMDEEVVGEINRLVEIGALLRQEIIETNMVVVLSQVPKWCIMQALADLEAKHWMQQVPCAAAVYLINTVKELISKEKPQPSSGSVFVHEGFTLLPASGSPTTESSTSSSKKRQGEVPTDTAKKSRPSNGALASPKVAPELDPFWELEVMLDEMADESTKQTAPPSPLPPVPKYDDEMAAPEEPVKEQSQKASKKLLHIKVKPGSESNDTAKGARTTVRKPTKKPKAEKQELCRSLGSTLAVQEEFTATETTQDIPSCPPPSYDDCLVLHSLPPTGLDSLPTGTSQPSPSFHQPFHNASLPPKAYQYSPASSHQPAVMYDDTTGPPDPHTVQQPIIPDAAPKPPPKPCPRVTHAELTRLMPQRWQDLPVETGGLLRQLLIQGALGIDDLSDELWELWGKTSTLTLRAVCRHVLANFVYSGRAVRQYSYLIALLCHGPVCDVLEELLVTRQMSSSDVSRIVLPALSQLPMGPALKAVLQVQANIGKCSTPALAICRIARQLASSDLKQLMAVVTAAAIGAAAAAAAGEQGSTSVSSTRCTKAPAALPHSIATSGEVLKTNSHHPIPSEPPPPYPGPPPTHPSPPMPSDIHPRNSYGPSGAFPSFPDGAPPYYERPDQDVVQSPSSWQLEGQTQPLRHSVPFGVGTASPAEQSAPVISGPVLEANEEEEELPPPLPEFPAFDEEEVSGHHPNARSRDSTEPIAVVTFLAEDGSPMHPDVAACLEALVMLGGNYMRTILSPKLLLMLHTLGTKTSLGILQKVVQEWDSSSTAVTTLYGALQEALQEQDQTEMVLILSGMMVSHLHSAAQLQRDDLQQRPVSPTLLRRISALTGGS